MKKTLLATLLCLSTNAIYSEDSTFNDLDCSEEEINSYLDQSNFKKPKGFNTIPSFKEYSKPLTQKEVIEEGQEAASQGCATIFSDGGFNFEGAEESLGGLMEGVTGMVGGIGGSLSSLAESAGDNLSGIREGYTEILKESVCERLKPENFQETVYEQVEDAYSGYADDSILEGTERSNDTESFLQKIIENQIQKGNGTLLNLLDIAVGNDEYSDIIINLLGDSFSSELDALEDEIFGG